MHTIKPMMKVKLIVLAGTTPDEMTIKLENPEYEFIFGIGSGGLTPFEYELGELTTGDDITIRLQRSEMQQFFEHLYPPVLGLFLDCSELFINFRVAEIGPVDGREVVKAMAEMTARSEGGCGCGGSCGCS